MIDRAKAIASEAAPRVLYRQQYAADNPFAAAFRHTEELAMVRNIVSNSKPRMSLREYKAHQWAHETGWRLTNERGIK